MPAARTSRGQAPVGSHEEVAPMPGCHREFARLPCRPARVRAIPRDQPTTARAIATEQRDTYDRDLLEAAGRG